MDPERLVSKGTFLAVICQNDNFRICRLEKTSILCPEQRYPITWLKKANFRKEYMLSKKGTIFSEKILCEVNLIKINRFKYQITEEVEKFIQREIKYFNEELHLSRIEQDSYQHGDLNENFVRENTCNYQINRQDDVNNLKEDSAENISKINIIQHVVLSEAVREQPQEPEQATVQTELTTETIELNQEEPEESGQPIMETELLAIKSTELNQSNINPIHQTAVLPETDQPTIHIVTTTDEIELNQLLIRMESQQLTPIRDHSSIQTELPTEGTEVNQSQDIFATEANQSDKSIESLDLEKEYISDVEEEYFEESGSEYTPSPKIKKKTIKMISEKKTKKRVYEKKQFPKPIQTFSSNTHETKYQNLSYQNMESGKKVSKKKKCETFNVNNEVNGTENNNESVYNTTVNFQIVEKVCNKRIYNKYHSCFICNEKCIKMARHLELKHSEHLDVARILAQQKKSKERRNGFIELIRVGDFYHNMEVLASKDGELILARRPVSNKLYSCIEFGPCPYCLGFMLKRMLWQHVKRCNKKKLPENENVKTSISLESNALVNSILFNEDKNFIKYILDALKNDEISSICKSDNLIRGVGIMMYEKHGSSQNDLIRQSMRQLGRLLNEIRENYAHYKPKNLSFFIDPQHFDIIINSVKSLCNANSKDLDKLEYGVPSLALKIGHSLRKCVGFLRGQSLRHGLFQEDQKLKSFSELLDLEWTTRISSNALSTMTRRKMNNAEILPLTSDLLKLNKFISKEIDIFKVLLQNNPSEKEAWLRLSEAILSRVILFNKRRSGEASRLTLQQFANSPDWSKESTEELQNSLTDFERQLAKRLKLVQIIGKRGRTVALILTEEVVSGINLLISTRFSVGVNHSNRYVFARPFNNSELHIRGSDALRSIVQKAELERPKSVTSTKLRKYVATVSQVFNLKDNELDWLARHLGHDIRVHRNFYRLHESAVEITKISRLLIAVDEGQASKFKGKQLDDINVNDLSDMEIQSDCAEEDEELENKSTEEQNRTSPLVVDKSDINKIKKRRFNNRRPWNNNEMKCVTTFFRIQIKNKTVPGKKQCDQCIEENKELLKMRSWKDIKYCVKNQIDRIKKHTGGG